MILAGGSIGRAGLTASRASLAGAGALAAAALTAASALGPAAIRLFRSFGSDASAAPRSITVLPSTSPRAAPLPFSNIISFMARASLQKADRSRCGRALSRAPRAAAPRPRRLGVSRSVGRVTMLVMLPWWGLSAIGAQREENRQLLSVAGNQAAAVATFRGARLA